MTFGAGLSLPGVAGAALAATAAVGLALFWGAEAATPRRVILQFLFRIGLPVAILLGGPLVLIGQFVEMDERLWQALIAGVVIATGWLTSAIFVEIAKARDKAEKLRDCHKALFAEIRHTVDAFFSGGEAEASQDAIIARMQADPMFTPFIPQENHTRVYAAMLERIEVLPRQTIDAVVAFYSVVEALQDFAQDMRGEGFRGLEQDRRIAMYQDYSAMRLRAYQLGVYTLRLILAYSDKGPVAADAVTKSLNTPGVDRRDPQQGSE